MELTTFLSRGEMTLQGGQYDADQYVRSGMRDEVESKIVSWSDAGSRILV